MGVYDLFAKFGRSANADNACDQWEHWQQWEHHKENSINSAGYPAPNGVTTVAGTERTGNISLGTYNQLKYNNNIRSVATVATVPTPKKQTCEVPREWIDGYVRMLCAPPCGGLSETRWAEIIRDTANFLNQWGAQAAGLGWTTQQVFGISPYSPEHRLDMRGLVPALGGQRIILLTADAATIDAGGDARHRKFRHVEDGAVPVWEMARDTRHA
jgi:hypothetical protein